MKTRRAFLVALCLACLARPSLADRVPLGVEEAIALAQQSHLRTKLSREKISEAEAGLAAAYSAFSPQISFAASQYNRSVNLASQGLSGSALPVPTRIGPFFSFDSHLEVLYRVYDAGRAWGLKGREIERHVAELQAEMESKAVTVLTSGTYILLLEAEEKKSVSLADVALAERLELQAANLEKAGVAAGVDQTRAQTRLAQRRLQLTQDEEQVRGLQRQLMRLTGLPLTDEPHLSDRLLNIPNPFPEVEQAVALARESRLEVQLAADQVALTDSQIHRAESEDSPTVDLVGSAGIAGNAPTQNSTFVHNVGISISWPLFNGGLTKAQSDVAKSRKTQAQMQLDDTLIQVESEVRDAYSQLETALQSISTAEQAVALASQELQMTEDRFQVGLTNNVELMAAEEALTQARYSRLQSLANYNVSLIRLASASGRPDLLLEAFRQANRKGATDE